MPAEEPGPGGAEEAGNGARCSALPGAPGSPLKKAGASPGPSTASGSCGGAPRKGRGRRDRARGSSAPPLAPQPGSPPRAALLPRRRLLRARGRRPRIITSQDAHQG
nr:xylosyltransferase 1-like isoform X2 [Anser cygnoides]